MAGHLAGYGAAQGAALAALDIAGVHMTITGVLAGLAFSLVTHGFIDRRWPVRWLLDHTGSSAFADRGGLMSADQALHIACCYVAALLVAGLS